MQPRLFIFGLGYTGLAFARAMLPHAASVGGTVRSLDKAIALRSEGIGAMVFDGENPGEGIAEALVNATHVVVTISQGLGGDPVLAAHGDDLRAAPREGDRDGFADSSASPRDEGDLPDERAGPGLVVDHAVRRLTDLPAER